MTEWKTYKIGDLCKISSSKRIFAKEYKDSGIPFYRGKEIIEKQKGNKISTELYISQKRYDEIRAKHGVPQKGDMLLTSVGTLGIPYIVQDEVFYFKDGNLTWFYNFEGLDSRYLYYWFLSPIGKMNIDSKAIGSTQKALTIETLSKFEISLPGLEEQRRIAGILGAIDDKIENNRRINTNLELQAQALFDKIFFDDNDVERNPLSDYANINPTRTLRQGVVARYIEMANLPTKGSFPSDWSYKSYGGGCKFANGDTIMARITPCLENGKTAYIDFLEEQEVAFGSTEYIVISAKSGYCPALFYFLARNKEFVDYAVGHMNGSSGRQRVGGVDIANFPMPHITLEDSNKFAEIAMPIMDVIRNNSLENRQLATLRDTLLPKLMNGEIKVTE